MNFDIVINPATPAQYLEIIKMLTDHKIKHTADAPDPKEEFDAGQITVTDINDTFTKNLDEMFPEADWFDL